MARRIPKQTLLKALAADFTGPNGELRFDSRRINWLLGEIASYYLAMGHTMKARGNDQRDVDWAFGRAEALRDAQIR